jgi:hypothetical protein
METADGVQGGIEKFRRIEMGDAESDGSLWRGAQELFATEQHGRTQPPAENKAGENAALLAGGKTSMIRPDESPELALEINHSAHFINS